MLTKSIINVFIVISITVLALFSLSAGVSAGASENCRNYGAYGQGYWLVASDGGIFSFGVADFYGSTGAINLNKPIVGMATMPGGDGYWLVASDGGIFSFGSAGFYGSTGAISLVAPIMDMKPTSSGHGYWLFAEDGGVFTFGDAKYLGSPSKVNYPVTKYVSADAFSADYGSTNQGYVFLDSGGNVSTFGFMTNYGSVPRSAGQPKMITISRTETTQGYWVVAEDGGVFTFGNAQFKGSTGAISLNKPIISFVQPILYDLSDQDGYRLIASDGGVFAFGTSLFCGSTGNIVLNKPIVGASNVGFYPYYDYLNP